MTIAEILRAKGVSEDTINSILADMKSNKIYTASEENLDIRYGKLKSQNDSKVEELNKANELIEELKRANSGNDALQAKVGAYESQIGQLQNQLAQAQLDSELKIQLLGAKGVDVDYLTFKLKEKGDLALDDQGKIKGWEEKLSALKTQFPSQFDANGANKIQEHRLPINDSNGGTLLKADILKMPYAERSKLYSENPDAYNTAMKS